jgi:hypothetical protein
MSQDKRALLIIGSPRCETSNSEAIGTYLMERLGEQGVAWAKVYTFRLNRTPTSQQKFLDAVDGADILVLASPLYIDSIPSFTIRAMELINEHRKSMDDPKKQGLFVIINCGFPEAAHNKVALEIYRQFAFESGIAWEGCANVGCGMAIDSRPLKAVGGMARNLMKGLDLAARSLAGDEPVSEEAQRLASMPFLPLFLLRFITVAAGKSEWNKQARANGAEKMMYAKPYEEA